MKPLVSIVVLNWNGKDHLRRCLASLKKVTYAPIEVIVVDNHSSDGSVTLVKKQFPWVKTIVNKKNIGYSGGNNQGIRACRGAYICILNNDTQVDKHFLEPLVEACQANLSIGCIQPKLLYGNERHLLNAVGSFLTSTGFLYHYGYRKNEAKAQYNHPLRIYSAKGAAVMVRKKALDVVGLFDEDFIIYFEETDLCHRLWLAGYTVWYLPQSVVYHFEAVDTHRQLTDAAITYLSFRNRIRSYMTNLSLVHAVSILIVLLPIYGIVSCMYIAKLRLSVSWAVVRSIFWNIWVLPKTLQRRDFVQHKLRRVEDRVLFRVIKRDPPIRYYYYLFTTLRNFIYEKDLV